MIKVVHFNINNIKIKMKRLNFHTNSKTMRITYNQMNSNNLKIYKVKIKNNETKNPFIAIKFLIIFKLFYN